MTLHNAVYLVHVCTEKGPLVDITEFAADIGARLRAFGDNILWTSHSTIRGKFWSTMHNTFLVFPVRDEIVSIYFW